MIPGSLMVILALVVLTSEHESIGNLIDAIVGRMKHGTWASIFHPGRSR
jgi:hypothetical protein